MQLKISRITKRNDAGAAVNFADAKALNDAVRTLALRHRAAATSLLAPLGLYPGQESLLLALAEAGPRTQTQLAEASGCEPPTITVSVRRLEAAGLVRRGRTDDRRVVLVELTEQGRALVPRLRRVWRTLAERTAAGVTATPEQTRCLLAELAGGLGDAGCAGRRATQP